MFAPKKNMVAATAIVIAGIAAINVSGADAATKAEVRQIVVEEAKNSFVPVELALAVARVESGFQDKVVSHAGARGVMQIMPATARGEFGVSADKLTDARTNVRLGVRFLEKLYRQYGNSWERALSHYNGGTLKNNKPHSYTRGYVSKVMAWKARYATELPVDTPVRVVVATKTAPKRVKAAAVPARIELAAAAMPVRVERRRTGNRVIRMASAHSSQGLQFVRAQAPAGQRRYLSDFDRPDFAVKIATRHSQGMRAFRDMINRNRGING